MTSYHRKSVYLCRAIFCKHKNVVWERVDINENVIECETACKTFQISGVNSVQ
jgi:hypothetical protein